MSTRTAALAAFLLVSAPLFAGEQFLPVIARGAGANNTFFRSDVRIVNTSSSTAVAELRFLPSGSDNSSIAPVSVSIGGREARDLDDILQSVFGRSAGSGALRISSDADLVVTSRTFTASGDPSCPGTYGQFIPALPVSRALTRSIVGHVATSSSPSSGFRANVGVTNPNPSAAAARLTLRNGVGGASIGTATLTLPPFSHTQQGVAALLNAAAVTSTNLFIEVDASLPVFAYVSVVDNQSGDQIFVTGEPDPGVARAGQLIIARQWNFEPATIEVLAGQPVTFQIKSIDVDHGISFSGVGPFTCTSEQAGQCILQPNELVTVTFTPQEKGSFAFFCTRFCGGSADGTQGHDTMRGTLVVK